VTTTWIGKVKARCERCHAEVTLWLESDVPEGRRPIKGRYFPYLVRGDRLTIPCPRCGETETLLVVKAFDDPKNRERALRVLLGKVEDQHQGYRDFVKLIYEDANPAQTAWLTREQEKFIASQSSTPTGDSQDNETGGKHLRSVATSTKRKPLRG